MKKIYLGLAVALALVFSGCSQKSTVTTTTVDTPVVTAPVTSTTPELSATEKLSMLISSIESNVGQIYFDFDKFEIREDMRAVVARNAELFKASDALSLSVKVEGNCDEWGTDEYNYALGLKRAKAVKDALIAHGVSESRIIMVSFGESNPSCSEKTAACWSQNRRADFKVLP